MKGKGRLVTGLLFLAVLVGACLVLYPVVSDLYNAKHATHVVGDYSTSVESLSSTEYQRILAECREFNEELAQRSNFYRISDQQLSRYEQLLDVNGDGVMGYVTIRKLNLQLPFYHGTDEGVLQVAVGHLEWTSLPVGGESSHCVLSAHRGLPSAKLFTGLDKLAIGDTFTLTVLNEERCYEVDQIRIVEPDDVRDLAIVEGEDYCTLVTCTPYGVNTHRLLVRGHYVDSAIHDESRVPEEADMIPPYVVAAVLGVLMVLISIPFIVRKR